MKKVAIEVSIDDLIKSYQELNSSYRVAEKYSISATAVKRLLKEAGVLRTQNAAASTRNKTYNIGKYTRTADHKKNLSDCAKKRVGKNNPFFGKIHTEDTKEILRDCAKVRFGERNPNFKDGKYVRRPRDYKNSEFKPLRNFVFNRDKHTCYFCEVKGGHLHAHHTIPYWVKPEAYLDVENLITVCTKCHFEKAHLGDWQKFDIGLVSDSLISKYSLSRERLNELAAATMVDAIVRTSNIHKLEEISC